MKQKFFSKKTHFCLYKKAYVYKYELYEFQDVWVTILTVW